MAMNLRFGIFSYVLTNYSRTLISPLPQVGADLKQEIVLETKHNILMHNILDATEGLHSDTTMLQAYRVLKGALIAENPQCHITKALNQ